MAAVTDNLLLRTHRFGPRIGLDGPYFGVNSMEIRPGQPWTGPGKLVIKGPLRPSMISLVKMQDKVLMSVGLYDNNDQAEKPSATAIIYDVEASTAAVSFTRLEAALTDILSMNIEMNYGALDIIFGDATVLDLIREAV